MTKLTLPLMGGLGNQLFQLQAALSLYDGEIELLGNIGNPRLTDGIPDVCHSHLPDRVSFRSKPGNIFIQKVYSLVLRISLNYQHCRILRFFVIVASSLVFSVYLLRPVRVKASRGLGYSDLNRLKGNIVLVGYFQSYRWESTELTGLFRNSVSRTFNQLKIESETKTICVLHIRLTDYLAEKNFGVLTTAYYEKALDVLTSQLNLDEIWLFSDDLPQAEKIIPKKYQALTRAIDHSHLKPIEILQAMTLGDAYVIANSTFSWWAAKLSNARIVVAPKPWFVNTQDPSELTPESWIQLQRMSME